ncbi:MAG: hypothetical protein ACTSPY_14995 [Candidatus Helarchaeota archaeon]
MSQSRKDWSLKNVIIIIVLIISLLMSIGSLFGLYYFYISGVGYIGIIMIIISTIILIISMYLYFSRPNLGSDRFFTRFEKKDEQNNEKKSYEDKKLVYDQIEKPLQKVEVKSPSVKELIEYINQFEKISLTEITDHFYPGSMKKFPSLLGTISWKTKEKTWEEYSKIKKVLDILINEKKVKGFINQLQLELYYFNPEFENIS